MVRKIESRNSTPKQGDYIRVVYAITHTSREHLIISLK